MSELPKCSRCMSLTISYDYRDGLCGICRNELSDQDSCDPDSDLLSELERAYLFMGLSKHDSLSKIKSIYRQASRQCHPDLFENEAPDKKQVAAELFRDLKHAYDTIMKSRKTGQPG